MATQMSTTHQLKFMTVATHLEVKTIICRHVCSAGVVMDVWSDCWIHIQKWGMDWKLWISLKLSWSFLSCGAAEWNVTVTMMTVRAEITFPLLLLITQIDVQQIYMWYMMCTSQHLSPLCPTLPNITPNITISLQRWRETMCWSEWVTIILLWSVCVKTWRLNTGCTTWTQMHLRFSTWWHVLYILNITFLHMDPSQWFCRKYNSS